MAICALNSTVTLCTQGSEAFKLENFFTILISFIIGVSTVYGGWFYVMIEQWLANGFLTWYLWKVAK